MLKLNLKPGQHVNFMERHYEVIPHPLHMHLPYEQAGGRGYVTQLKNQENQEMMALKVFKAKYRQPEIEKSARIIAKYRHLPGMDVAFRMVFTPDRHANILEKYPALEYAVLMPWISGDTWWDIIATKKYINKFQCLTIATSLIETMSLLEKSGLTHCDIAGSNMILEIDTGKINLIDIEEMYGANLPKPQALPAGQAGYQHKTSKSEGNWHAYGDRFATAILMSEILTWYLPEIRQKASKEHFFDQDELQLPSSEKYKMLLYSIRKNYSDEISQLLITAWESNTPENCPSSADWKNAILKINVSGMMNSKKYSDDFTAKNISNISQKKAVSIPADSENFKNVNTDTEKQLNPRKKQIIYFVLAVIFIFIVCIVGLFILTLLEMMNR